MIVLLISVIGVIHTVVLGLTLRFVLTLITRQTQSLRSHRLTPPTKKKKKKKDWKKNILASDEIYSLTLKVYIKYSDLTTLFQASQLIPLDTSSWTHSVHYLTCCSLLCTDLQVTFQPDLPFHVCTYKACKDDSHLHGNNNLHLAIAGLTEKLQNYLNTFHLGTRVMHHWYFSSFL